MSKNPILEIKLLGKPEIWLDGRRLTQFKTAKTEALIYYLAATGIAHSREALAGLLWAEMPDTAARRNLTKSLTVLRRTMGPYMIIESGQVGFDPAADLDLDLAQFKQALLDAGQLKAGIARYRGDFLQGFFVKDALEFENWQFAQRQTFKDQAAVLFDQLIEKSSQEHDYQAAIHYLRRRLNLDPWQEKAQRQLMVLLARTSQLNAALAQYQQFYEELQSELGVEPEIETAALAQRLRAARQKPAFALPHQPTPLIGREAELRHIQDQLANPNCRLLTITGLGGSGKTRLAVAAAHQANRQSEILFINGVAFFNLADLSLPSAVPTAITHTLDVPLSRGEAPRTALRHYLANKEMLLVLDNFEHVIGQVDLINELLLACPNIKFLVTSRESLNTSSEWRITLSGLPLPPLEETSPDRLQEYAAVSLFLRSALQVQPSFQLTAENGPVITRLCQLIDALPLALQLSATWLRAMSLADILTALEHDLDILTTEMRDIPQRQRSIRAILESTWNLLSAEEKTALETLSICPGGFNQQAARAIAGATPFLLSQIIDHALLSHQEPSRYVMHPLTRQFARQKLSDKGRAAAAAAAHGRYFLTWLADLQDQLFGPVPHKVTNLLKEELANLTQAWAWASESKNSPLLDRSLTAMVTFYDLMGLLQDGEKLLDQAIAAFQPPAGIDEQRLLCRLFIAKAQIASAQGSYDRANKSVLQAQALLQPLNDDQLTADIHDTRGRILTDTGQYIAAKEQYWRAIEHYRGHNAERKMANTLSSIGWTAIIDDSLEEAVPVLQEALAIERKIGHKRGEAQAQGNLAVALSIQGHLETALQQNLETLALYEEMGDMLNIKRRKNNLAMNLLNLGRLHQAQQYAAEAVDLAQELGALPELTNSMDTLGTISIATGHYPQAQARLEEAHQLAVEMGYTYLDLSLQALLVKVYNRTGQFNRLDTALPAFQSMAERLENGFYIARALAENAYLAQAQGHLQLANQRIAQAINIVRQHAAQGDLPHFLLQRAGILRDLQQNGLAYDLITEAAAIAGRIQHAILLFFSQAMSSDCLQALGQTAEAAQQMQEAYALLPQLQPYPDVLTGLLYAAHYHFADSNDNMARKLVVFVVRHPAASQVTLQKASQLLDKMTEDSEPHLQDVNPLQWSEILSLVD